jgi:hypothetical protein
MEEIIMKIKKGKSVDEIEIQAAGITLLMAAGLVFVNFLVMLIPNDIIRFSIIGIELLGLTVVGYILLKAVEDIVDKSR